MFTKSVNSNTSHFLQWQFVDLSNLIKLFTCFSQKFRCPSIKLYVYSSEVRNSETAIWTLIMYMVNEVQFIVDMKFREYSAWIRYNHNNQ